MDTIPDNTPRGPVRHLVSSAATEPAPRYLADEVGHLSLYFLFIDATRYNLGRPGEPAQHYAEALAKTLPELPPYVRQQLVQDVALALNKDSVSVAVAAGRGGQQPPGQLANMSAACRQAWQGLLQVAAVLGTAPN